METGNLQLFKSWSEYRYYLLITSLFQYQGSLRIFCTGKFFVALFMFFAITFLFLG